MWKRWLCMSSRSAQRAALAIMAHLFTPGSKQTSNEDRCGSPWAHRLQSANDPPSGHCLPLQTDGSPKRFSLRSKDDSCRYSFIFPRHCSHFSYILSSTIVYPVWKMPLLYTTPTPLRQPWYHCWELNSSYISLLTDGSYQLHIMI